jgi:hypothetical protein
MVDYPSVRRDHRARDLSFGQNDYQNGEGALLRRLQGLLSIRQLQQ